MTNKPKDPSIRPQERPQTDSTAAFTLSDPAPDKPSALPPTSPKLLDAIRGKLANSLVKVSDSGFYTEERPPESGQHFYKTLPSRLQGAWSMDMAGKRMVVAKSHHSWLVIYDIPPEKLYEEPRLMSINLRKRDI